MIEEPDCQIDKDCQLTLECDRKNIYAELKASHEKLKTTLKIIENFALRASLVQDRSVGIIKGTCRDISKRAKQALKAAGEIK